MYAFLGLMCLIFLVSSIFFAIRYFISRKKNRSRARRYALYTAISIVVLILSGWGINQTPEGKQEAKNEARESSLQKGKDSQKESAKKASSIKAASIKEAKSASQSSAKKASTAAKASSESQAVALKKAARKSSSIKKVAKEKAKYASYKAVTSTFPKGAQNYSASQLLKGGSIKVDTKVIDLGADGMHQYHMLLKEGKSLMLFVVNSKKTGKVVLGDRLVVYGMINGTGKVNSNQTNVGLSNKYQGHKVGLLMDDKVVNEH